MRTYHLYLLLKLIHEASPADDVFSAGLTPGQLSKLIIEASRDGFILRGGKCLTLTESGLKQLKDLESRKKLIVPASGEWIKPLKNHRIDSTRDDDVYIP